jgi:hypothetical protein
MDDGKIHGLFRLWIFLNLPVAKIKCKGVGINAAARDNKKDRRIGQGSHGTGPETPGQFD